MKSTWWLLFLAWTLPAFGQYYDPGYGGMGGVSTLPPAPPPPPSAAPDPYAYRGGYGSAKNAGTYGEGDFSFDGSPGILNYNNISLGYRYMSLDEDALPGANGLTVDLMVEVTRHLFLRPRFTWVASNSKGNDRDYDFTQVSLGAGGYFPITSWLHLMGEGGFVYGKRDGRRARFDFDETALFVRPAVRVRPLPFLELQSGFTFTSADEFDSSIWDVQAFFRLLSQLDLGVAMDFGDMATGFTGGLRFRW
jgi:hypothetical protein